MLHKILSAVNEVMHYEQHSINHKHQPVDVALNSNSQSYNRIYISFI